MSTVVICKTHQFEEVEHSGVKECWECVVKAAEEVSFTGTDSDLAKEFTEFGFYLVPGFDGNKEYLDKYLSDCLATWFTQIRYTSDGISLKPYSASVQQTSLAPGDIYSSIERSLCFEEFKKDTTETVKDFLFIRPCETLTNALLLQEYLLEEFDLVREN